MLLNDGGEQAFLGVAKGGAHPRRNVVGRAIQRVALDDCLHRPVRIVTLAEREEAQGAIQLGLLALLPVSFRAIRSSSSVERLLVIGRVA